MARNTFAIIGILAVLLLSLGMVSAYSSTQDGINVKVTSEMPNPVVPGISHDITVNVTNNNGVAINLSWTDTSATSGITATVPANDTMANGTTKEYNITYLIPSSFEGTDIQHKIDLVTSNTTGEIAAFHPYSSATYTTTPTLPQGCTESAATNTNTTIVTENNSLCTYPTPVSGYNFCENGMVGDLEIVDVTFNNLGQGDDDDWFLLDEIEIEVEVENTHSSENVKDVLVEIKILDSGDNDVTNDFDFDDEEISLNTIKNDDSEYVTFKINEVPADLDSGRYQVYIKAYSEDNESGQCVAEAASKYLSEELYQKIDVTREDDPAVIVKETMLRIPVSCGDNNVELPLNIYNLGSDKEEKILVHVYNTVLGINQKIIIDNLKSGKKKQVTFYFDMPQELSKELYILDVVTYYDYDDDEDEMLESSYSENSEDDLDKDFNVKLEILSCSGPTPTINANLESAAEMGTDLVIKTLITNNGEDNSFIISASDFESWADLVSVTPQTASINQGEFTEVTITLKPKVAGAQSFKINSIVDGESYSQLVSVNIDEQKGMFSGMNNALAYVVIGIVAVLVLIFLVLVVRISRRQVKPQF